MSEPSEVDRLVDERRRLRQDRHQLQMQLQETQREVRRLERQIAAMARCGKVPLRTGREADQFLAWVAERTGQGASDFTFYPCPLCPPSNDGGRPFHIGHVRTRGERTRYTPASLDDST